MMMMMSQQLHGVVVTTLSRGEAVLGVPVEEEATPNVVEEEA